MRNGTSIARTVALVGILAFALVGFGAFAEAQEQQQPPAGQQQPAPAETPETEEQFADEVVVTGSMIPRPTLEEMSPVTTLDVEEITYRGITRLEDLLTSLPQVFAAQNSTIANGASGTATIDLRDFGAVRTLVLIDGRRMSNGDAFSVAPDLNFIPAALVKRVDVLTGGASSVYGADAVAGVVNFVLDKDFEGFRGGVQFGSYQHDNNNELAQEMNAARGFTAPEGSVWAGNQFNASIALGGKFANGKGHGSMYIDYRKTSAMTKADRDYVNCSASLGANGPFCGGSSTVPDGRFMVYDADWNYRGNYTLDRNGPGNTFRPRVGTDVYNYAPHNYMQRPDERWAGGGFVNYEWNEHVEAYGEVMLMDDYTDAQIAPSGDFGNTEQLNCDNPMLSAQQRQLLCTDAGYGPNDIANIVILKRNVEGGPRVSQLRHTALRLVAGLKGEIDKAWSYDVYGLNAEVHSPQSYLNDLNASRLQDALIVDGDPNDPSTWHCRSGNAGCVPWNIFQLGGVTQEALTYLSLPMVLDSGTRTRLASAKFMGDLGEYGLAMPTATEGIQLATGAEYREEYLFVNPDLAYREGLGAGQGGPTNPVEGSYFVKELFAEMLLPIIQDAPGAQDLSFELGYRYSDYSTSGAHPSWKVQGNWAPMMDFKVRAGVNRATRAPNVQELFAPQGLGLGGSQDICAGENPTATLAQCQNTGVTPAQYGHIQPNPADQYNTLGGGNPLLVPEVADTLTVGLVFTPLFFPGFTATFDYYDIQIEDTIGALGADDIINTCATTGNPLLCSLIHRDVAGTLWLMPSGYTETTNQNIGKLGGVGVDLTANYMMQVGNAGFLSFNLVGTYAIESTIDTGLYAYDCVGYFGNQCGIPNPEWRHLFRMSWDTNFKTAFSLGWRMVGPVTNDDGSPNPAIGDPGNIELLQINDIYELPAYNYLDLAASYKMSDKIQLTFGINNVLDEEPPLAPGMQDADYGPGFYGTYDPYGRYVFTGVQFTF
jgi:outer membrane receptor protein involved in Fe transport